MVYTLFIDRVEQVGDEWYTFAAMRKTNSGGLRDEVVVRTTTQPTWQPADQVRMYLQCTGGYEIQATPQQSCLALIISLRTNSSIPSRTMGRDICLPAPIPRLTALPPHAIMRKIALRRIKSMTEQVNLGGAWRMREADRRNVAFSACAGQRICGFDGGWHDA